MVQNQPCWDACYTVGLSNQRQVKLYLCDSVALFWMSHCVTSDPLWWLYTAWSDRVKGPYTRHWKIGHFRVPLCLCFKASLSAKPFIWKWVWFECKWNCMQNSFSYRKGFDSFWHRGTRELGNGLFSSRWIKNCHYLALDSLRYGTQIVVLWANISSTTTGLLVISCCPCEAEFLLDDNCTAEVTSGTCTELLSVSDGLSFSGWDELSKQNHIQEHINCN